MSVMVGIKKEASVDTYLLETIEYVKYRHNVLRNMLIEKGIRLKEAKLYYATTYPLESWNNWCQANLDYTTQYVNSLIKIGERFKQYINTDIIQSIPVSKLVVLAGVPEDMDMEKLLNTQVEETKISDMPEQNMKVIVKLVKEKAEIFVSGLKQGLNQETLEALATELMSTNKQDKKDKNNDSKKSSDKEKDKIKKMEDEAIKAKDDYKKEIEKLEKDIEQKDIIIKQHSDVIVAEGKNVSQVLSALKKSYINGRTNTQHVVDTLRESVRVYTEMDDKFDEDAIEWLNIEWEKWFKMLSNVGEDIFSILQIHAEKHDTTMILEDKTKDNYVPESGGLYEDYKK